MRWVSSSMVLSEFLQKVMSSLLESFTYSYVVFPATFYHVCFQWFCNQYHTLHHTFRQECSVFRRAELNFFLSALILQVQIE